MPRHAVDSEAPASRELPRQAVRLVRDAVFRATVRTAGLTARDLLAVAVSGGPDSIVLLDALLAARERGGPALHVLHFDHGWHDGSAAVASDVQAACRARGVAVTSERAARPMLHRGESREMTARRIRHDFLRRVGAQLGVARVATGHQADDQVETILMNLARGGGPDALQGMRLDDGRTLRPLLSVWRGQIEAYACQRRLPVHRDPANDSSIFRRNRVRHELIPLLDNIYPGARKALLRAGGLAVPAAEAMVSSTQGLRMPLAPDRRAVPAGPLRDVLNAALRTDERSTRQLGEPHWRALDRALADNTAGRWIQLPGSRWAYVRDRAIALYSDRVADPPWPAPVELSVPAELDFAVGRLELRYQTLADTACDSAAFEALAIPPSGARLGLRTPRQGDWVTSPVDGRQHNLLRLLRRRRLPAALRGGTPVVTLNDQPICVPGVVVDADHRPSPNADTILAVSVVWAPLPRANPPGGFVTESPVCVRTLDSQEKCESGAREPLI